MAITLDELADLREHYEGEFPSSCELHAAGSRVSDGMGGFLPDAAGASVTLPCRYIPRSAVRGVVAGADREEYDGILEVPYSAEVSPKSRFVVAGASYAVVALDLNRDDAVCQRTKVKRAGL